MKIKKKLGLSLTETLVTLTVTSFSMIIFASAVASIQKSNSIVNRNVELRDVSNLAKANIEKILRSGFYFFSQENTYLKDTNTTLPSIINNNFNNVLFENFNNLPTGANPQNQSTLPGNVLYFLTQEMLPLREVINPNTSITTSSLPLIGGIINGGILNGLTKSLVDKILISNKLPTELLDSKVRILKLNMLYLEKNDSTDPYSKGTYNLVHAVSNYEIYHKAPDDKIAENEGSIVWSKGLVLDNSNYVKNIITTDFKIAGPVEKSIENYLNYCKKLIYQALSQNQVLAWDKPKEDGSTQAILPTPTNNPSSINNYTKRVIARNIGIKEAVGPNPFVNLPDPSISSINDDLNKATINNANINTFVKNELNKKYNKPTEWYGISFKYLNQKFTVDPNNDDPSDTENQRISKVVEVTMYNSIYDNTSKQVITTKNVFKVIPRNLLKRSI